jgi:hypothetical protein
VLTTGAASAWTGLTASSVSQGNIFTLSTSDAFTLTATSVQTGARAWIVTLTDDVVTAPYKMLQAYNDSVVYSGKYSTQCFDATTGALRWKTDKVTNGPQGYQLGGTIMLFGMRINSSYYASGACVDAMSGAVTGVFQMRSGSQVSYRTQVSPTTVAVGSRNGWAFADATCALAHDTYVYNYAKFLFVNHTNQFYVQSSTTNVNSGRTDFGIRQYDLDNNAALVGTKWKLPWSPNGWFAQGPYVVTYGPYNGRNVQVWNFTNRSMVASVSFGGAAWDGQNLNQVYAFTNDTITVRMTSKLITYTTATLQTLWEIAMPKPAGYFMTRVVTVGATPCFLTGAWGKVTDSQGQAVDAAETNLFESATGKQVFTDVDWTIKGGRYSSFILNTAANGDATVIPVGTQRTLSSIILRTPLPTLAPPPAGTPAPAGAPGGNSAWLKAYINKASYAGFILDTTLLANRLIANLKAVGVTIAFADIAFSYSGAGSYYVSWQYSGLEAAAAQTATMKFSSAQFTAMDIESPNVQSTPSPPSTPHPQVLYNGNKKDMMIIYAAAGGAALLLIIVGIVICCCCCRGDKRRQAPVEDTSPLNVGVI